METKEKKKIKDSVKAIIAFVSFLVVVALISVFFLYPMHKIYSAKNNQDVAFVGASQWRWQLNPEIVDATLESNCCVLAGDGFSLENRYDLVHSAVTNAHVDTVVLEISCNRMAEYDEGLLIDNIFCINQLYSAADKFTSVNKYISFWDDEYDALYAKSLDNGLTFWRTIVLNGAEYTYSLKGCTPQPSSYNLKLSKEEAEKVYNEYTTPTDFLPNNEKWLRAIIEYCQSESVNVVIITTPLAEQKIWRFDGWDNFHDQMVALTSELDVPYYDINLLKNRSDYFDDEYSFTDTDHLTESYSPVLSAMVADLVKSAINKTAPAYEFYYSYAEAKANSVYAAK